MPWRSARISRAWAALVGLVLLGAAGAGASLAAKGDRPRPDAVDVPYGPHPRQRLDFWLPRGERPAPLVVFFHGGGFLMGDKASVPAPLLRACLDAGFAVASANYRYSTQAPYPAPMQDGARALQFLRQKGAAWRIDPAHVALAGDSAGAGIALWIGAHDDLAAPSSESDPIARQSTRVSAVGAIGGQTSYDPRFIREHIGGRAAEHRALRPLFGLVPGEPETLEARARFADASPIVHATADDPPSFLYYGEPDAPLPLDAAPGRGIHHPNFGKVWKARMDTLGVRCVTRHQTDPDLAPPGTDPYDNALSEMAGFFAESFRR